MDRTQTRPAPAKPKEEHEMKVLRNFEALFIATLGLACAANYAVDSVATHKAEPSRVAAAAAPYAANAGMQVVVVSAKRMSAAEKAASLAVEQKNAKI
jgi:hypothetical protein